MELHYYKGKTGALYYKWLNSIYLYKSYIYQIYKTFPCWYLPAHTTEKNSHLIVIFSQMKERLIHIPKPPKV